MHPFAPPKRSTSHDPRGVPTLTWIAAFVAFAAAAGIPFVIWLAGLPPEQTGPIAVFLQQPLMGLVLVFFAVAALFIVMAIAVVVALASLGVWGWRRNQRSRTALRD